MPLKRSLNSGSSGSSVVHLATPWAGSVTPSAAKSGSFMAFWPEIVVDLGARICYTMYIVRR